jgi:uncharacterized membrane protein HdeD (DUF308 family)
LGHRSRSRRGARLLFVEGVLRIAVGLALVPLVGLTAPVLGYVIASVALVSGAIELWLAWKMRHFAFAGPYWGLAGVASLLLGLFLAVHPEVAASLLVLLIGLYALLFGASMLALAHRLHRIERRLRVAA